MSFGFRELNLPKQLANDELVLKNDELRNDIAYRKGKRKDLARIALDTFMIEQDRAAIELMNRFAEIWAYTIDHDTMKITVSGNGDRDLQAKFSEVEKRFDGANDECHKHSDSPPFDYAAKTAEEAQARCADLRQIYLAVLPKAAPVQQASAGAPGAPGGCVSDVEEIPYYAIVESDDHKSARQNKDKAQHRCDEILLAMKQEAAKCKTVAATTDETDADQSERVACVQEERRLSALGDSRYAELNAAARRLNAVTQKERAK